MDFFSPKMVPFHDFFVKIDENKGKTLVFDSFPLFFIGFGRFLGKSWNATIFGSKKYILSIIEKNFSF